MTAVKMVQLTPDFRTAERPVIALDRNNQWVEMTLCEELIEGRWESFYSIRPLREARA